MRRSRLGIGNNSASDSGREAAANVSGALVEVSFAGSRFLARRDNVGFHCPFCNAVFFEEKDLTSHIIAHAQGLLEKRRQAPRRH